MASKDKKSSKGSKDNKKAGKKSEGSLANTATEFLGDVEKAGEALVTEVKQLFDSLSEKVVDVTSAAAETTVSVAEKVTKEPTELLRGLANDVKEAGETSMRAIGEQFDALTTQLLGSTEKAEAEKKKSKKKKEKKEGKAVAAKGKKEEKIAKKKASTKKKTVAASKAPVAKKTTVSKKTAAKKTTARKKAVAKKTPVRKKASVKTTKTEG